MSKNWNNFCASVALFLTFSFSTQAQLSSDSTHLARVPVKILTNSPAFINSSILFLQKQPVVQVNLGNPFSHWGIMCFGEYQLERKTGIPFRFRLGSLEYVNKLEGKK